MSKNPNIEYDESLEQIKIWWSANGRYLIAGVVIGIVAIVSWSMWDRHQVQKSQEASGYYMDLTVLVNSPVDEDIESKEELINENSQKIQNIFSKIKTEYQSTPYAPLSALLVAKYYIEQEDLDKGEEYLELSREYANDQGIHFLEGLSVIRIARLLLAQGKKNDVLDMFSSTELPAPFQPLIDEIRANILASDGKKEEAASIYRDSQDALNDPTGYINMKLQRLGIILDLKKNPGE